MKYTRRSAIMGRGRKLPKKRRQYYSIYGLDAGLDYSKPSTMIDEKGTPNCDEVSFRYHTVAKTKGTFYFSDTNTAPLTNQVMYMYQYYKTTGTDRLMLHTFTNTYTYNSTSDLFECITRGVVVEDCEDVWSVNANVTVATDTDARKGTKSVKLTIAAGFTTGVAAYENFAGKDLSSYTYLHYYIKSDIATSAGDLVIRLSEENAGGTGASYADYNVPALTAGVWKEVAVALASPDADGGGTYPDDMNAVLSVSLVVGVDNGAQVVHIDDVINTIQNTGDEDNQYTSVVMNNYYIFNHGIQPIEYWDQAAATTAILAGCTTLAAKKIGKFGERVVLFHVIDTGTAYPQRAQWTVAGGISTPPNATDWSGTGSGNTDLESTMGSDFIMAAEKLGNYYIIYGERTIVQMEYTGKVSTPFSFYTRVSNKGLPAEKAIVNTGNRHIFLGWDNIYSYVGGKEAIPIGEKIKNELFNVVQPEYISRCFMVYIEERDEVRLFYPSLGATTPDKYFSLNLLNGAWSKGTRSYTAFGFYTKVSAETWDTIGESATTPWDDMALGLRWDDAALEALSPIVLFGTTAGKVEYDNESSNNLAGVAIDGIFETKDLVTGERYRGTLTNWMQFNFEARGDNVDVSYSVDQGNGWSTPVTFSLTSAWAMYTLDFEANSNLVRFKFRNNTINETWEARFIEPGFIPASDRGN